MAQEKGVQCVSLWQKSTAIVEQILCKPYLHIRITLISFFKGVQQKRPTEAQSVILRRYFLELTESFIIPLVSCIAYTKKSNKEGFFFLVTVYPRGEYWVQYCSISSLMTWMMGQLLPSASLQVTQLWEEWLILWRDVLPLRVLSRMEK